MALRFKYRQLERPEPLGPTSVPVIPLTYVGRNGESFESPALLDSGADYSVIFREHAEILGIDLAKCKQSECQGIGGKVTSWIAKVPLRLRGKGEHRTFDFEIPVMILERQKSNFPLLLGRAGFFEKFEITFNEGEQWISLKPLATKAENFEGYK